ALFAPVHLWNLGWGFQIQFVGVYTLAVAGIYALVLAITAKGRNKRTLLTFLAIAAFIAGTFTMANGCLIWPIAILMLCLVGQFRTASLFLIIGAACVLAYSYHLDLHTYQEKIASTLGPQSPTIEPWRSFLFLGGNFIRNNEALSVIAGLWSFMIFAAV